MTQVTELHNRWIEEPEYQKAYKAMAPEFEVTSTVIAARKHAGLILGVFLIYRYNLAIGETLIQILNQG